jgi:hypothetical protein
MYVNIDGKPGKRLGIVAYGVTPKLSPTSFTVLQCIEHSTVSAAVASGATTITATAFTTAPATGATFVIVLDNATYQWLTVASTASTTSVPISSALTDTLAAGNKLYNLGIPGVDGHNVIPLVASTYKENDCEAGLFWSNFRGAPIKVNFYSADSSAAAIDYVTYVYTNV